MKKTKYNLSKLLIVWIKLTMYLKLLLQLLVILLILNINSITFNNSENYQIAKKTKEKRNFNRIVDNVWKASTLSCVAVCIHVDHFDLIYSFFKIILLFIKLKKKYDYFYWLVHEMKNMTCQKQYDDGTSQYVCLCKSH